MKLRVAACELFDSLYAVGLSDRKTPKGRQPLGVGGFLALGHALEVEADRVAVLLSVVVYEAQKVERLKKTDMIVPDLVAARDKEVKAVVEHAELIGRERLGDIRA